MMVEGINCQSRAQKVLRIFPRPINRIDESDFDFAGLECLPDKIDIVFVAAGVLNFAPAQPHLTIDPAQQRFFPLGLGRVLKFFSKPASAHYRSTSRSVRRSFYFSRFRLRKDSACSYRSLQSSEPPN